MFIFPSAFLGWFYSILSSSTLILFSVSVSLLLILFIVCLLLLFLQCYSVFSLLISYIMLSLSLFGLSLFFYFNAVRSLTKPLCLWTLLGKGSVPGFWHHPSVQISSSVSSLCLVSFKRKLPENEGLLFFFVSLFWNLKGWYVWVHMCAYSVLDWHDYRWTGKMMGGFTSHQVPGVRWDCCDSIVLVPKFWIRVNFRYWLFWMLCANVFYFYRKQP